MTTVAPPFSVEDAQLIVNTAEACAQPNMKAAMTLSGALARFARFYDVAIQAFEVIDTANAKVAAQTPPANGADHGPELPGETLPAAPPVAN